MTAVIDGFLAELVQGSSVRVAFEAVGAPGCVRRFVQHSFDCIERGDICAIASAFTFGREDLLPAVFQRIVEELNVESGGGMEDFRYYLKRHIDLDGEEHGPLASRLILSLCGSDEARWQTAEQAAVASLESRRDLWDGMYAALRYQ